MIKRYPWIILVITAFLVITIRIDNPKLSEEKGVLQNKKNASGGGESIALRACDSSEMGNFGQLVPDQGKSQEPNEPGVIGTVENIPNRERSSRAGFGVSTPTDPGYWAGLLGSGWYLDWSIRTEPLLHNLDHWQMIRVHEDCIYPSVEEIQMVAAQFPGQVWIIGNEPDVIWQDNVNASTYAIVYHDLDELIKSADPTALIAVGGISQSTPLRLRYLDQVLQSYREVFDEPMPVDWWTIHGYVLREEKGSWGVDIPPGINEVRGELREVKDHGNIDIFKAQILSFRNWMAENGYQNSPLALTEFGILMPFSYGFPDDLIAGYLEQTFLWLSQAQDDSIGYPDDSYHLVQKWAWFSISDPIYSSSNLGDLTSRKLTLVGERFRSMIPLLDN